jgi:hypothetical protein
MITGSNYSAAATYEGQAEAVVEHTYRMAHRIASLFTPSTAPVYINPNSPVQRF